MSRATPKPTASSEKLKWQAKSAFNDGHYTLAIELFSYALEQVPHYAPYLTNRALCYYRLDDADKVLKDANASIQSDPKWVKGYFYKGKALEMLNRKDEAIQYYRKCCELEPDQKEYRDVLDQCLNVPKPTFTAAAAPVNRPATHSAQCDVCGCNPIVGVRYKCSVCPNYDLCLKCTQTNPNQKGHRDTHALTPIKQPSSSTASARSPQFDVSFAVHSYNVILVVDVSLSMIGYEANGQINPAKNRWPATERGIIKIANQLTLQDRLTCLAFNGKVYRVIDGEAAQVAKLGLALALAPLKPDIDDANPGTALYDAIESAFETLVRNKLAGVLLNDSNRNQIVLITDGEDCSSTSCDLTEACTHMKGICDDLATDVLLIGIGLEFTGRLAMQRLQRSGGNRCKFLDLKNLAELDDIFDRISLVFTKRTAVIDV